MPTQEISNTTPTVPCSTTSSRLSSSMPVPVARRSAPHLATDGTGFDVQRAKQDQSKPSKPTLLTFSATQSAGAYWLDATNSTPPTRMFPGIVHERTRRGSIRRGSSSDKDTDASVIVGAGASSRPLPSEFDKDWCHDAVAETTREQ